MENLEGMSIEEIGAKLDELKERLMVEGVTEEERAQLEVSIKLLQDQLDILMQKAYQAAREAARLDPENPMVY